MISVSIQFNLKINFHCPLQVTNLTTGNEHDVSLKKTEDPSGTFLDRIIHFLAVLALNTLSTCSILAFLCTRLQVLNLNNCA